MMRRDKGALAGILGASCCVVPLALIAAGLGSSLLTVFLVRYKAYLMAAALGALAWAWRAHRREQRACEEGACEIAGGSARRWLLWANTAVVAFFFIITYTPVGALVGVDVAPPAGVSAPKEKTAVRGRAGWSGWPCASRGCRDPSPDRGWSQEPWRGSRG